MVWRERLYCRCLSLVYSALHSHYTLSTSLLLYLRTFAFPVSACKMAGGSNPLIIEAFTLLAVALTIVFLRTYARASSVGVRRFQLDDYVMLLAAVSLALPTGFVPLMTVYRSSTPSRRPRHTSWELGGEVLPTTA